jgi:hypothetical protein
MKKYTTIIVAAIILGLIFILAPGKVNNIRYNTDVSGCQVILGGLIESCTGFSSGEICKATTSSGCQVKCEKTCYGFVRSFTDNPIQRKLDYWIK